ncbi:hypothetical protein SAMN05414139_05431 [Burkholderia sp. D7]|nr:hypothetical protein SAMN05414139_05431 [Burkholderia sp. D7]
MKRSVESDDRKQIVLLPESVDDCSRQVNPVKVINVFADELDFAELGFNRATSALTGRSSLSGCGLLQDSTSLHKDITGSVGPLHRLHSTCREAK